MVNNFITTEANKDIEATNYAFETLTGTFPSHPAEATEISLLIGAAASKYAEVIKFVPAGGKIAIAITLAGGGTVNTFINIAKGDESGKALVSGIAGAIASAVVGDIYDWVITPDTQVISDRDTQSKTIETTKTLEQSLSEYQNALSAQNQNWDIHATIPSVSNPANFLEQLQYDSTNKTAIVKTPDANTLSEGTTLLVEKDVDSITINNHTVDVVTPTNLELRNALTSIDDYQFLLSHVLIKPGERLDMGTAGIITVSSGDTLSQLAVTYLGGNAVDATRNAVFLNPWLADAGRIQFNAGIDKVLIKDGASLGNNDTEHFYTNQTSADFFYDANGGYDHYYAGNQDIIKDSDGRGEVYFDTNLLSGTKTEVENSNGTLYEDANYTYSLQNPNGVGPLTVIEGTQDKGFSGKSITIEDYINGNLEINLGGNKQKDIQINITDPSMKEGDSGITLMSFVISSSVSLVDLESVTLDLSIGDIFTDANDYGSLSHSSITLDKNNQTQTVTLEIIGDTDIEQDEELWLESTVNTKEDLGDVKVISGLGNIEDDDGDEITVDVADAVFTERDSGTPTGDVEVTVTTKTTLKNDITVTLSDGTTVVIDKDTLTGIATISWQGDTVPEADVQLQLSAVSSTFSGKTHPGKTGDILIEDDDGGDTLEIKVSDSSLDESNANMIFTVSLIGTLDIGESLTVNLSTSDGSAFSPDDYAGVSGTVYKCNLFTKKDKINTIYKVVMLGVTPFRYGLLDEREFMERVA